MTNPYQANGDATDRYVFDPVRQPDLFDGVLSRRIVAFCVPSMSKSTSRKPPSAAAFSCKVVCSRVTLLSCSIHVGAISRSPA